MNFILILAALISSGIDAQAARHLPADALVLETGSLSAAGHPELHMVLWMLRPERHPDEIEPGAAYTCPQQTLGSYYQGPTRVSLFDTGSNGIINTIEIRSPDFPDKDRFAIPYLIRPGYYYRADSTDSSRPEKPTVIDLRDLNGDGRAMEFVLYEKANCSKVMTALIGYSERQNRVIQYPVDLVCVRDGRETRETWDWTDYLFLKPSTSPGNWSYDLQYHGPPLHFTVHYDSEGERFYGKYIEGPR